jgi:hypothetical protein
LSLLQCCKAYQKENNVRETRQARGTSETLHDKNAAEERQDMEETLKEEAMLGESDSEGKGHCCSFTTHTKVC